MGSELNERSADLRIIESFIRGKYADQSLCEDGIFIGSKIVAVIDGATLHGEPLWNGGRSDVAYVDDIPRHARFELGDVVETSGFSSVFPPGIYVGRVADIHDSADGLAYQLEVELSTDLANVRDVCIVMQEHEEELDSMTVKSHR